MTRFWNAGMYNLLWRDHTLWFIVLDVCGWFSRRGHEVDGEQVLAEVLPAM